MFERAHPPAPVEEPEREPAPPAPAGPRARRPLGPVRPRAPVPHDAGLSRALAAVARERRGAVVARSKLSHALVKAKADGLDKTAVLAILRKNGAAPADADAQAAIAALFTATSDERWLADHLLALGPEPLWPAAVLDERAKHAPGPEAGIEAALPYPPEAGKKTPPPVRAYFFPGV